MSTNTPTSPSRLAKLKAMSLREVASRASYAGFLALERRRVAAANEHHRSRSHASLDSLKGNYPMGRFFAALREREVMRRLFEPSGPYAAHADASTRAASAAKQHQFSFFGSHFSYGREIDWHADPVTGRAWPRIFHRDVPIHNGSTAIGDVKYVWELNRHQFLIDLGKAYWLFDDRDAAAAIYGIVRHWIAENPCGIGVNWSCALEPAFRIWSWLWAYAFCLDDPALDTRTRALWQRSFGEHGDFLYHHLEYYASPYNHLIGEASALYALGVLFPSMPGAAKWRRRGRRILESRLASQFHADGGSVEQSTFYHHATLGFYVLGFLLAEANGEPFPEVVRATIETATAFSMSMQQPDGRQPSIGGADDGKCVRMEHLPFWDFRAFPAIGAVLFDRRDFRFAAGEFFEDALWLLGPAGREQFHAMSPVAPAPSSALSGSGYYVLRSDWSPSADYLCFDCGEQAGGLRRDDVPSAGHGHADCLSVVLWLRGRPVLVDPGFYCYNGDPDWEVHFRRTRAHNTATVDGQDQSRHIHKMAWTRVFEPTLEAWRPADRGGAVGGSHDGFLSGFGVIHRRAVWLHEAGYCAIVDQFAGDGAHDVELTYQLAPGHAEFADDGALLFDHAEIAWAATVPVGTSLRHGDGDPDGGWIATSLGVKQPAPRLSLRLACSHSPATCLVVVAPRRADAKRRSSIERAANGRLAIAVAEDGGQRRVFDLAVPAHPVAAGTLIDALTVRVQQPTGRPQALLPLSDGC